MVLELARYRLSSYFGIGCSYGGHDVPVRPLNGSTISRPPFESFSNYLGNFINEVAIVGMADFVRDAPSYGLYRELVPFYGHEPVNYPFSAQDGGLNLPAVLAELTFSGLDDLRTRVLAAPPAGENPVLHHNLSGGVAGLPGRSKTVGYSGYINDGFPSFPFFAAAPATILAFDIPNDFYVIVNGAIENYSGRQCYLIDGVKRIREKMAAGHFNTTPAPAGVGGMLYSTSYDNFSWKTVSSDPWAVSSVEYDYKLLLTAAPLFDSEEATYHITISWELPPGPIWDTSPGVVWQMPEIPNLYINQNFRSNLMRLVVTNRLADTPLYQYGGYSSLFTETLRRQTHSSSTRELYQEPIASVYDLLETSDTPVAPETIGRRLPVFCSLVAKDIGNFQPLRFMAFTDAINSAIDRINSNFIESGAEFSQILRLLNVSEYFRRFDKLLRSGKKPSQLLDVLSSSYLTYKYGIVPTIQDAKTIVSDIAPVIQQVKTLSDNPVNVYGSSSLELPPGTYGYSKSKVVCTSKVRGRFNLAGHFLGLYLADAVGVLPTFERFWDLVDFSFVVDMFANIDDRLKIFDDGFRTTGFILDYHVSTLKVMAELDDELLAEYSLCQSGTELPRLVHMTRNVSRFAPSLGQSAYDITPPSNPDWIALGALIFQKLK